MDFQICLTCHEKKPSIQFQASGERHALHKCCVECRKLRRLQRKRSVSETAHQKNSVSSKARYRKKKKAILKYVKYVREEENAWRKMFGEDPFDIGAHKKIATQNSFQ